MLGNEQLYIGQTADLTMRLKQHDKEKDFWQIALACYSLKEDFETTELLYLEQLAIEYARKVARYELNNGTAGNTGTRIREKTQRHCQNMFAEMQLLLAVAKHDFLTQSVFQAAFSPVMTHKTEQKQPENMVFYCRRGNADAMGYKLSDCDKFVLLAGSLLSREQANYLQKGCRELIQQWLAQGILEVHNHTQFRLTQNQTVASVSTAATLAIGKNANGWVVWKAENDETLDKMYRNK